MNLWTIGVLIDVGVCFFCNLYIYLLAIWWQAASAFMYVELICNAYLLLQLYWFYFYVNPLLITYIFRFKTELSGHFGLELDWVVSSSDHFRLRLDLVVSSSDKIDNFTLFALDLLKSWAWLDTFTIGPGHLKKWFWIRASEYVWPVPTHRAGPISEEKKNLPDSWSKRFTKPTSLLLSPEFTLHSSPRQIFPSFTPLGSTNLSPWRNPKLSKAH